MAAVSALGDAIFRNPAGHGERGAPKQPAEHHPEPLGERDAPEQPAEHHVEPLGERGASEQPAEHHVELLGGPHDPWRMILEDEYYRQLAMLNDAPAELLE